MKPYLEEALIRSLRTDSALEPDAAEELMEEYPFFSLAASRGLMSQDITAEQRARFLACVALNAPDMSTLVTLIDPHGARFANFYPDENQHETPSTESAIDTFLDTYGRGIDPKEEALLERLIFNPTPDYSEVLVREAAEELPEATEVSEQDAMLDAFLLSQNAKAHEPIAAEEPQQAPERHVHRPKPDPEAPLSESLAKIFIKRGRYDKAFEIIRQLSLNFPEKSIYFADQLRFLQKLILNQQYDKPKK